MNTWIWPSSFFPVLPFIKVLTCSHNCSSFSQNSTFIRSSMSGQIVVFGVGGEELRRKKEKKWKSLLEIPNCWKLLGKKRWHLARGWKTSYNLLAHVRPTGSLPVPPELSLEHPSVNYLTVPGGGIHPSRPSTPIELS